MRNPGIFKKVGIASALLLSASLGASACARPTPVSDRIEDAQGDIDYEVGMLARKAYNATPGVRCLVTNNGRSIIWVQNEDGQILTHQDMKADNKYDQDTLRDKDGQVVANLTDQRASFTDESGSAHFLYVQPSSLNGHEVANTNGLTSKAIVGGTEEKIERFLDDCFVK